MCQEKLIFEKLSFEVQQKLHSKVLHFWTPVAFRSSHLELFVAPSLCSNTFQLMNRFLKTVASLELKHG